MRKLRIIATCASGTVLSLNFHAGAAIDEWLGTSNNIFAANSNWSQNTPPNFQDGVFDNAGNGNTTITGINYMKYGAFDFNTGAASYTVGSPNAVGQFTVPIASGAYAVNVSTGVVVAETVNVSYVETSTNGSILFQNNSASLFTEGGTVSCNTSSGSATVVGYGSGTELFAGSIADGVASGQGATAASVLNVANNVGHGGYSAGTLILAGNNTYMGTTTVSGGSMYIDNTAGSGTGLGGNVNTSTGTILGGYGTIGTGTGGTVDVKGMLRPGDPTNSALTTSASLLTVGKAITMEATSVLNIVVNSAAVNASTTSTAPSYGQLLITSSAGTGLTILPGATISLNLGYAPVPNTSYVVIDNNTALPISGTFSNLPDGGTISAAYGGQTYQFSANYEGTGTAGANDLVLTSIAVPEPVSSSLLVGLAGLLMRRRRTMA